MSALVAVSAFASAPVSVTTKSHQRKEISVNKDDTINVSICGQSGLNVFVRSNINYYVFNKNADNNHYKKITWTVVDDHKDFHEYSMNEDTSIYVHAESDQKAKTSIKLGTEDGQIYLINVSSAHCSNLDKLEVLFIKDKAVAL